jgi:excisionase family DNA binding protein
VTRQKEQSTTRISDLTCSPLLSNLSAFSPVPLHALISKPRRRKQETMHEAKGKKLEPLLTIDGTAEILNSSPKTVRRLIAAKELPVIRLGRLIRIHVNDLERLIASRRAL